LFFIIEVTLPQIAYIITLTPDKSMICTCLMYPWLCVRREFFILVLKFLMLYPQHLRTFLVTP